MAHAIEMITTARVLYGFSTFIVVRDRLTGMLFNNVDTEQMGLTVTQVNGRNIPLSNDNTLTIPGRQGLYYYNSQLGERVLEVKTYIKAVSKSQYTDTMSTLKALLNPIVGEKKITFNDDPDRYYYGRLKDWQEGYQINLFSEQLLIFACSDPYIYGPEIYTRIETSTQIENQGTQKTSFIATVTGPAIYPMVEIGDKWFRYDGSLMAGDELEINTHSDHYSALLNGANVINNMSGEFFQIAPGVSNVSVSSGVLELAFVPRWL